MVTDTIQQPAPPETAIPAPAKNPRPQASKRPQRTRSPNDLVRSVRAGGDTKTKTSRRALELPQRAIDAFRALWDARTCDHGEMATCTCLVFVTRNGTAMEAHNVRRDFRTVMDAAGLVGKEWTPRELRHSFVSLLSDEKVPIERISRLVGHRSTVVIETVYRKQLRPVVEGGATVMDRIFPTGTTRPGRTGEA
jgi:integrase